MKEAKEVLHLFQRAKYHLNSRIIKTFKETERAKDQLKSKVQDQQDSILTHLNTQVHLVIEPRIERHHQIEIAIMVNP